jgi:CelD/BcsL family acetyltransferase involved in cellulose biosynthesis
MSEICTRILTGFDDPACAPDIWMQLLARSPTNVVFLASQWQRAWWETRGEGDLLLVAAYRDGRLVALAPFYASDACIYFVGAGWSDYHDFLGDSSDPQVLAALLAQARDAIDQPEDMKLHLVPEPSPTGPCLAEAAQRLGLEATLMNEYPACEIDLADDAQIIRAAVSGSMLAKEDYFRRHGELVLHRLTDVAQILPRLEVFYAHHVARWTRKDRPSEFADVRNRHLLERFLELAATTGWIRYLQIDWKGEFLAAEFAWYYHWTHFAAPWCFNIAHANHSPGRVLLRHSILAALDAGLRKYDFGGGQPDANFRLPIRVKRCQTWGIYPP